MANAGMTKEGLTLPPEQPVSKMRQHLWLFQRQAHPLRADQGPQQRKHRTGGDQETRQSG